MYNLITMAKSMKCFLSTSNIDPKYKYRPGYEQNLQRWTTKCEVDNNKGIAHYFGNLLVDSYDDYITDIRVESFFFQSERFYISKSQLQFSEIVIIINNLDDDISNHQIIQSEWTVLFFLPTSYVFNLSNDLQYNDIEFKGLLIDSTVLVQMTGGIDQLKPLQQLNTFMQLDKTIAVSANFLFGISSILSIGSIN